MPVWRKRLLTPEWRQEVRAIFKATGRGAQAELCRQINDTYDADLKEGTVSLMLKDGRQESSKWVEPISKYLGIPLPPLDSEDGLMGALLKEGQQLDEEDLEHLVAIAKKMNSKG